MRRLLAILFVLASTQVWAADGPNGSYVKEGYVLPFPLTPLFNLAGRTDSSGNLLVINDATGTGQTPLTPIGQLAGRTDSSGNLYVNCSGCTSTTPTFTRVGIGVAPGATALLTLLGGGVITPSADSTAALIFTKADAATAVLTLDTTNKKLILPDQVGGTPLFQGSSSNYGFGLAGATSFEVTANGTLTFLVATNQVQMNNTSILSWAGSAGASSAQDTGMSRNAAGVVEVNNGVAGTFRDLKIRTLNVTSGEQNNGVATILNVASNFTTAANTNLQTITGLTVALPATTVLNVPFTCKLLWSQATAAVAVSFGVQSDTLAPTSFSAMGQMETNVTVTSYGDIQALNTTTATAVVTGTPAATATIFNAYLDGFLENPSGAATNLNIMVKTATGADAVTVYRGSFCRLF